MECEMMKELDAIKEEGELTDYDDLSDFSLSPCRPKEEPDEAFEEFNNMFENPAKEPKIEEDYFPMSAPLVDLKMVKVAEEKRDALADFEEMNRILWTIETSPLDDLRDLHKAMATLSREVEREMFNKSFDPSARMAVNAKLRRKLQKLRLVTRFQNQMEQIDEVFNSLFAKLSFEEPMVTEVVMEPQPSREFDKFAIRSVKERSPSGCRIRRPAIKLRPEQKKKSTRPKRLNSRRRVRNYFRKMEGNLAQRPE
ncbi:unnamed protein product [Caenorhabditis auriculariae]|uniref:Uncharacterized protein n=1 Tax=Caenorhabditis auriculariae TaxID=2777116 RepID=A0A8S1HPP4_9PELO|nr:unnamed protein product [Caenorhabditis auriculariae]